MTAVRGLKGRPPLPKRLDNGAPRLTAKQQTTIELLVGFYEAKGGVCVIWSKALSFRRYPAGLRAGLRGCAKLYKRAGALCECTMKTCNHYGARCNAPLGRY